MIERNSAVLFVLVSVGLAGGCSAPTATLDLITVAQKGIHSAREDAQQQHAEIVRMLKTQAAALDSAFDADVRLAASGQIKKPSGEVVQFTPEWVISARKGYTAARDLLADQIRSAETAHTIRRDNLNVAEESLEMASQLVIHQWNVAERIKQHILNIRRSLQNDR